MNILGKHVVIRAIEREDLDLIHRWSNDPEIWYQLGGWHFPGSRAELDRWHESLASNKLNQRFAITAADVGLIGTANLVDIDWKNNHAFHGMMLGDTTHRGKGYGFDTVMAIMRYAFEELHLERLDTTVIEYNDVSLHVYAEKCGWKIEGRQHNWYFRKNRYWDRVLLGITRDDHAKLLLDNRYWMDR